MVHQYPAWPKVVLPSGKGAERATRDWDQGTALGPMTSYQLPEIWDPGECSCLDQARAELEQLLKALDAYIVDH